jgi:ankyrin repeat protein
MIDRIADGRTDLVFPYLEAGNAADACDADGVSLIRWCAYYGDVSAIRHLIGRGAALPDLGDNFDLNGAAFHGHWRLCEYLIENGADVNHPLPQTRETPLHAALCKLNRPADDLTLQVLLAHGADPNARTAIGVETGSFMRDCRTRGETPLHRAAAFGSVHAVRMLLDAGAVVDARDAHGETPLSWASWRLRPAKILALLCHDDYRISEAAVGRDSDDQCRGWSGLDAHLLGRPHSTRRA